MADLARAVDAFRRGLRVPFREDARWIDDLALEASPVIEGLAFAIGCGDDPSALEYREGLALGALLGRRAALHAATPSVALALVDALAGALGAIGRAPSSAVVSALRTVVVEGYCAAIEERVRRDAARRAAAALTPQRVAPRCWAIVLAGEHDAELLEAALDRSGRALLDADARACIVHLAMTIEPSEELAAAVLGFDATARMIGVEAVFTGVGRAWIDAARARLDPTHVAIAASLEEGLARALEIAGAELRAQSVLVRRFRRLLGNERRGRSA